MDVNAIANDAAAQDDTKAYERDIPDLVQGRHLQADADIFAYDYARMDESYAENVEGLKKYIQVQRMMAGAEVINLHLTMGDKGGRNSLAMVKEYQGNRNNRDPEKQQRVRDLRTFMSTYTEHNVKPYKWTDQEADDGMAQFQIYRMQNHGANSSVIMTVDKDLDMVPGIALHPQTYEERIIPDGYGHCDLLETPSGKKVKGMGTSFFWHQLLMGDSADDIPGCPKVSGDILNIYKPTKAILNAKTPKARAKAMASRKPGQCGAVTAYEILVGIDNDMDAYLRVRDCYESFYGKQTSTYLTWRGDEIQINARLMLLEQARLLWMRRVHGEDVVEFFREIAEGKR